MTSRTARTSHVPATYQEGQLIEVTTVDVAHGGWCVARPDDGPVVFVRHALPGETVRAKVTDVTSRLARAEAIEILAASPDRVEAPCPHARPGGCGGCDWQHATLPAQRALKAAVLRQQLRRLAGLDREITVEPLPGDEEPGAGLGWRTRVQFAVRPDGVAGLRAHRSHEVVDVGECLIAHQGITELGLTTRRWPGSSSVEALVATGSGERAVIVSPAGFCPEGSVPADIPGADAMLRRAGPLKPLKPLEPLNRRLTPVRGHSYLSHHAAGRDWRVSAGVFWQVHPGAADALTDAVTTALEPQAGDVALDLYCGAGLFAGAVAPLVGADGAVTGVESDAVAIKNARQNLSDCPWVKFLKADVAQAASAGDLPPARLVIADPPRAGLARELVDYLTGDNHAERFAYASCDPATLARDLALLISGGWQLENLRAFDAFPMTHHVECVAILTADGVIDQSGEPGSRR